MNREPQPQGEGTLDYDIATDDNTLDGYPDANFYTIRKDLTGSISFTEIDEPRGTIAVINGKAYPNAYYYKTLRTGQGSGALETLKNIFDFEISNNNTSILKLDSIIPAEVRENGHNDVDLIKRGKLIFK